MQKKNWMIDVALLILIVVMGVFIYFRLGRVFNSSNAAEPQSMEGASTPMVSVTMTSTMVFNFSGYQQEQAPDFTLSELMGGSVSLSDYLGYPVMINFWATWCPPCKAEMPIIQQLLDAYPEEFVVLAVNVGENEDVIREFANENDYNFIFLLDPSNSTADLFGVSGYPTSVFIDGDGHIHALHIGELSEELLTAYLREIGVGE